MSTTDDRRLRWEHVRDCLEAGMSLREVARELGISHERVRQIAAWDGVERAPGRPRRYAGGVRETPEYQAWASAKQRTTNPRHPKYPRYGGRGITMAPEWRDDFQAFYQHIGPRPGPGHSLDRVDNDRGYEPGNVRWSTAKDQAGNRGRGYDGTP